MLRIATLAALAATLVAAPANAASIRISTEGKSPAEVKAEVSAAAYRLCRAENLGSAFADELQRACLKATIRASLAEPGAQSLKLSAR